MCVKSYIGESNIDPKTNYLASPLFAPDYLLAKFPMTRLQVGSEDPLLKVTDSCKDY